MTNSKEVTAVLKKHGWTVYKSDMLKKGYYLVHIEDMGDGYMQIDFYSLYDAISPLGGACVNFDIPELLDLISFSISSDMKTKRLNGVFK